MRRHAWAAKKHLRKSDLEPLLNSLEHLLVGVVAHKGNSKTLGTETTSTTDTVEVGVGIRRQIVVDREVDALDVDTTTEDVRGNTDALVELLELLVTTDTNVLLDRKELLAPASSTYRSSWLTPEWTAMEGKLHSRSSLSNSVARRVLLTKMMTWLN